MKVVNEIIRRPYFDISLSHRDYDRDDISVIDEIFKDNVYRFEGYHLSKNNPVVLDIGANIGAFTLLTLKVAQETNNPVTVYAVEPEENNLFLLKKNLEDNPRLYENGSRVFIVESAISYFEGRSNINDKSGSSRLVQDDRLQSVDVITFDMLIEHIEEKQIDFTKIDIEGSEVSMIKYASAKSILASHFYAIECDESNNSGDFMTIIKPFLNDFSFSTWGVPNNGCNLYLENHRWAKDD